MNVIADRRVLQRGAAAGDLNVRYSMGERGMLILLAGSIHNGDGVSSRNCQTTVRAANGSILFFLGSPSVAPGTQTSFPLRNNVATAWNGAPGVPLILAPSSEWYLQASVVAAGAFQTGVFAAAFYAPDGGVLVVDEVNI